MGKVLFTAPAPHSPRWAVMLQRLIPAPRQPITAAELAAGDRHRRGDRPWVGLCMVASLDGSTAVADRSGGLSSPNDAALLGALRAVADVVVVGAGTIRAEGYGPPRTAGQRIGVISTTGDVDVTSPLFAGGAGFLILPEDGPTAPAAEGRPVDVVRAGTGSVDLAQALARLDTIMEPPTFVQAEGGPRLNATLLEQGCLDELNLTISPRVVGGRGRRVVDGAPELVHDFDLVHLATDEQSFLYGRWLPASTST